MSRAMCYRCFWPQALCWCASIQPMPTRTKFVFLMHPKEFKQAKAATGRLTHLCLPHSEIHMGVAFDDHAAVAALLRDPHNLCLLLYPGAEARNLSAGDLTSSGLGDRQLVIVALDATWSCARKMLKLSPCLQRLARAGFSPGEPSRYRIKRQPEAGCLSTLEAIHDTLLALARSGLDDYVLPGQLLQLFHRMQDFQIACARDPERTHHVRPVASPTTASFEDLRAVGTRRRQYLRKATATPLTLPG